ncbi:MAG: STT3 domain-containing protein [Promethearchaeota archaeon]
MVSKFRKFFSDLNEKIKTSVRFKPDSLFLFLALILIIILGVLVRCSPIFRGEALIKAFDPWMQYHTTDYLVHHSWYEYFHWHSYKSWYPGGIDRYNLRPGLIFSTAALYEVFKFFGIPLTLYDVAYMWPALMGGLTILVMYYLGKEVLDERTGLLAAFFLAFSPGHMQRTMLGFFDNETIGVLSVLLTFLFFIKAVKTGRLYNAVFAGLSLGYLALSWGGLTYGFLLLPLISAIMILAGKYSSRLLMAYVGTISVGVLIYMVDPRFKPEAIFDEMETAVSILFIGAMLLYHMVYMQKDKNPRFYKGIWDIIKWGSIPTAIVFGILFYLDTTKGTHFIPFNLTNRGASILNPAIRKEIHLVASVGEHKPSPWSVFYFNAMIPVILTPLGFYFALKRLREEDILMMVFVLTLFYFTGSMIRIILLLAPALSLIGAYGLTYVIKFFGSLFKKKPNISRRRKRQIRKTLGPTEGTIVLILISVMAFTQLNHATTTSINQMSWSEIVPGGVFHDWEESLTYIRDNLPGTSVVVSWWDYGYYLTVLGNVTTVNDNATLNYTRIGLTGMALMQTNEIYSAQILKALHADYVMVYFGHLLSGLGGDEGKWPWMLRICNDHTQYYVEHGYEQDNWYGDHHQVDTVFDEAEYINSSSGLYRNKWFESTLVKLMFYGEPTSSGDAKTQLEAFFAQELEGNQAQGKSPRMDDYGNTWMSHIPNHGYYNLTCFVPYYFSSNHLVKIYKVDYTALESSFELGNSHLYENGIAYFDLKNTGTRNITIDNVNINGIFYNYTIEDGEKNIQAGATKTIWVNTNQFNQQWNENDYYNITVQVEADALMGRTFTFINSTKGNLVEKTPKYSIKIDRDTSIFEASKIHLEPVTGYINVTNTGDATVRIAKQYKINGDTYNISEEINHNFIIKPGETEEFTLTPPLGASPGFPLELRIDSVENATDAVLMSSEQKDYKISILPFDRVIASEENMRPNPDLTRKIIPVDLSQTYADSDGNINITVKNTGSKIVGLQSVSINDLPYSFTPVHSKYFLNPGESEILSVNYTKPITPNEQLNLVVTATGQEGDTSASDNAVLVPVNTTSQAIAVLTDPDFTKIYTNETVEIAVKNVGLQNVTIDGFEINGTYFSLNNAEDLYGSKTLGTYDVYKFRMNITGVKINQSDTIRLRVKAGTVYSNEETVNSILPLGYSFMIIINNTSWETRDTRGMADDDVLQIALTGLSFEHNMTIDTVEINGTYVDASQLNFVQGSNLVGALLYPIFQIPGNLFGHPDLIEDEYYQVKVTMVEGPVEEALIKVVAT